MSPLDLTSRLPAYDLPESIATEWENGRKFGRQILRNWLLSAAAFAALIFTYRLDQPTYYSEVILLGAFTFFGTIASEATLEWAFEAAYRMDADGVVVRRRLWSPEIMAWNEIRTVKASGRNGDILHDLFLDNATVKLYGTGRFLLRKSVAIDISHFDDEPQARRFIFNHLPEQWRDIWQLRRLLGGQYYVSQNLSKKADDWPRNRWSVMRPLSVRGRDE